MRLASLAASVLAIALPAFAQASATLMYALTYDDPSLSLDDVACSTGVYGLETKGYTTLGSLPNFPFVGGVFTVTGWNSPACGTCYNVTYGDTTIPILAVDSAVEGFILSEEAMNTFTGGPVVEQDVVKVTYAEVDASFCGM